MHFAGGGGRVGLPRVSWGNVIVLFADSRARIAESVVSVCGGPCAGSPGGGGAVGEVGCLVA